jgi:RNA exonuclease NGL2
MTYTALTKRPIHLTPRQELELKESVEYEFRSAMDEEEEFAEDSDIPSTGISTPADIDDSEPATSIPPDATAHMKANDFPVSIQGEEPLNITRATLENNTLVLEHHASNPPLKSLYSLGLKLCQPDNAINAFGEPPITNWAHRYKETLDYIFVVQNEMKDKVKLLGLLKMPRLDEMGEGEPQEGRFPSDHVCEMVEVELS